MGAWEKKEHGGQGLGGMIKLRAQGHGGPKGTGFIRLQNIQQRSPRYPPFVLSIPDNNHDVTPWYYTSITLSTDASPWQLWHSSMYSTPATSLHIPQHIAQTLHWVTFETGHKRLFYPDFAFGKEFLFWESSVSKKDNMKCLTQKV